MQGYVKGECLLLCLVKDIFQCNKEITRKGGNDRNQNLVSCAN